MNDTPEFRPPRKIPKPIIWLMALLGLFLLNVAIHFLLFSKSMVTGWMLLLLGFAILALALLAAVFHKS